MTTSLGEMAVINKDDYTFIWKGGSQRDASKERVHLGLEKIIGPSLDKLYQTTEVTVNSINSY